MKKTATLFAVLTLSAASLVAARDIDPTQWDHANDSNYPLANVQEVRHPGVKKTAKKDDRIKFVAQNQAVPQQDTYQYLGRSEHR